MSEVLGRVLVARQPIVSMTGQVVGYELLHRPLPAGGVSSPTFDGTAATAQVIVNGLLTLGREALTGGLDAWINIPAELFRSGELVALPPEGLVLEVLEDTEVDDDILTAIRTLRAAGFRVALDDVVPGDRRLALVDEVDVVKVDLLGCPLFDALELIRSLPSTCTVLAEKVEDGATVRRAIAAGATLLQGYHVSRPQVMGATRPLALPSAHLRLLQSMNVEEVDLRAVAAAIRDDVVLSDRFLRVLRAGAGWRPVTSIHDGLLLLGERAVRRWVSLLVLAATVDDGATAVVARAGGRARFCEHLADTSGTASGFDAFLLGMFSVLGDDGRVAPAVLAELPLDDAVHAALTTGLGPLRPLVELALQAEAADWDALLRDGTELGFSEEQLAAANLEGLRFGASLSAAEPAATVGGRTSALAGS
ncbi:EAL and HDOD domain-containing protein [Egicoccus sp. AB-alg6-2]|uniref:EAL and HDOD domain-containing protein n=1 Tax=Egicoccus sp. AB-alg6-2 TaxID=3242692 RepID=UPI00359DC973